VSLQGCSLQRADLQRADLKGADLRGVPLQGAYLQGADLREADLRGADLSGANLRGARLQDAQLRAVDLRGANLLGCIGLGGDRGGSLIDVQTFQNSQWSEATLLDWRRVGARLEDFPAAWPESVALHLRGARAGLSLLFRKRPGRLERHVFEAVVMAVLGPEVDVEVALLRDAGMRSSLHISGPPPESLEQVVQALRQRDWVEHPRSEMAGRVRRMLSEPLLATLGEALDRGDRYELWTEDAGRLIKRSEWSPGRPRLKVASVPAG